MRKMVLISLDAVFDEDIAALPENSFIKQLLNKSAVSTKVKTVFPALTYPAHTTLVTGCDPAEHGIAQNQPFQPGKDESMRAWYWQTTEIKKPSLFDAVHQAGGKCASILWPVSGKSPSIRWNFPEVVALPGESQTIKMLQYGTPMWVLDTEIRLGRKRVSAKEPHLSEYGCILACDVIRHKKPDLTALHMVDVDDMRHHYGVHSPEAKEALRRMDDRVRRLWETVQNTKGMEDALFVLVSDHGQADVHQPVHLGEVLDKAGYGECVQVQSNGMSAYLYEGKRGKLGVAQAIAWLDQHMEEAGISHLYDWEELEQMGCAHDNAGAIEFAVEAAEGVVFCDGLEHAKREKATHGFGPGHPAENCLLAVSGKGIQPVTLPEIPMRDVAPTLAECMGIPFPSAKGKSHANGIKVGSKH